MNWRRTSGVAFLAALTLSTAPASAGLLPDIRGMNFGASPGSFQGVQDFNGFVSIPPITGTGTAFFDDNPTRVRILFDPYPGVSPVPTFSVVADPSAPTNPGRIDIQTRFGYGAPTTPMSEILAWDLIGTYNQTTGAISVMGSKAGPLLYDDGLVVNPFGNGANFELILGFTALTYSLHGTLTQGANGLTITGSDSAPSPGVAGNIGISGTTAVYFNPVGDYNIADAEVTGSVADGQSFGSLTNWSATTAAVPEPASVVMFGLGMVGVLGYRWRRRSPSEASAFGGV